MSTDQLAPRRRGGPQPTPAVERFYRHVDDRGPGRCHPWTGSAPNGHGEFRVDGVKRMSASAFAALLKFGHGPGPGEVTLHTCVGQPDSELCCNGEHLFYGRPGSNKRPPADRYHHNSKLSRADEDEVLRRALAGGESIEAIRRDYDISAATVYRILAGRPRPRWYRGGASGTFRRKH